MVLKMVDSLQHTTLAWDLQNQYFKICFCNSHIKLRRTFNEILDQWKPVKEFSTDHLSGVLFLFRSQIVDDFVYTEHYLCCFWIHLEIGVLNVLSSSSFLMEGKKNFQLKLTYWYVMEIILLLILKWQSKIPCTADWLLSDWHVGKSFFPQHLGIY